MHAVPPRPSSHIYASLHRSSLHLSSLLTLFTDLHSVFSACSGSEKHNEHSEPSVLSVFSTCSTVGLEKGVPKNLVGPHTSVTLGYVCGKIVTVGYKGGDSSSP